MAKGKVTDFALDFVCPSSVVAHAGDTVRYIGITIFEARQSNRLDQAHDVNKAHRAIRIGFPLSSDSSSARSCISRSIRSASLYMSLPRSVPVTFFPHAVLNALRAAATARSMSFSLPVESRTLVHDRRVHSKTSKHLRRRSR